LNTALRERPTPDEYAKPFERYVARVAAGDVLDFLESQRQNVVARVAGIPEARGGYRYAEDKWSVGEVVGHVIDTERVFAYRALCIARGETLSLPAFDEQEYMKAKPFDGYTLPELAHEFDLVRQAGLSMLRHLDTSAWLRRGTANQNPTSVRAIAYVMAGHVDHHLAVLADRYRV